MRRSWKAAAVTLFAGCLLFGGLFGDRLLALDDQARAKLQVFTELLETAHESHAGEVAYSELVRASIEGMVRTLDPHTSFMSADAYSGMRDRQQASFYGLGILVGMRNRQLTVITPLDGTPAAQMGIRAGDVISAIEGEPTEAININEAVRKLKGPKGTKVSITIARPGLEEQLELTIVRDEIPQNTVRYAHMMTPEIGYFVISDFNRGTGREVAAALEELKAQGMKRLLIDLRTNGGGLLDQAIAVVEHFVPEGSRIVETRGRTRDSFQEFSAKRDEAIDGLPLVVLVGEGTASAAEIFAGAVQDHDVGLIVGTPTWGKGLVQTVYSLSYGSGLALTTAKYFTPSGRLIQRDYSSWFDYASHNEERPDGADDGELVAYHTDLGREVYGGGGIEPDVEAGPEEIAAFLQFLLSRNAFFDFAVEYANGRNIETGEWRPDPDVLDRFASWVVEHELATEEELREGLPGDAERAFVMRYLEAEILNSTFGFEARFKALAKGDPQIQRALELFDDAASLLARRQNLESGGKTAALDLGN